MWHRLQLSCPFANSSIKQIPLADSLIPPANYPRCVSDAADFALAQHHAAALATAPPTCRLLLARSPAAVGPPFTQPRRAPISCIAVLRAFSLAFPVRYRRVDWQPDLPAVANCNIAARHRSTMIVVLIT